MTNVCFQVNMSADDLSKLAEQLKEMVGRLRSTTNRQTTQNSQLAFMLSPGFALL